MWIVVQDIELRHALWLSSVLRHSAYYSASIPNPLASTQALRSSLLPEQKR